MTWSAVWVLPGALTDVPTDVTVNGVPLVALKTPFNCQPPAMRGGHALGRPFPARAEGQLVDAVELQVVRAVEVGERAVAFPHRLAVPGQPGVAVVGVVDRLGQRIAMPSTELADRRRVSWVWSES